MKMPCRRNARFVLAGLALASAATLAHAGEDDDASGPRFCSATAWLLYQSCQAEVVGDQLLARAKCVNVADPVERRECIDEAAAERTEAREACREQLEARREACNLIGEQRYDPDFDPLNFDADFRQLSNPNPYFPLGIGQRREYAGGDERTVVEVLDATKQIEGVTCIVVRDLVYEDDELVEATDDWFAAGRDGSSWYCGEEAKDYESFEGDRPRHPELVSIDGSFKHGRERDKAGIIMPARPQPGQVYQEEFSLGNAEDIAEVVSVGYAYGRDPVLDRHVPAELAQRLCQDDCVVTRNTSLLEPGQVELKYHARGIGVFLETVPDEGKTLQLVGCNFDARCVALPAP